MAFTSLRQKLQRPYVHLLFGARQTGKSTLLRSLLPPDVVYVNLADPQERSRHLADPGEFAKLCRSLPRRSTAQFVFVDEAQLVPALFDAVQMLYDEDKTRWRFILCGSSARKLRQTGANLLPGRSIVHHLYPLTLTEYPSDVGAKRADFSPLPLPWLSKPDLPNFPAQDLMTHLAFGSLPGIITAPEEDRTDLLRSYAFVHLEEEMRRESLVRDWGAFLRFLKLAAFESGRELNYAAISQESGISQPTVKSHYQLLEDMFMGFHVSAFSKSPRKNILSTPKFIFFDLGIRHAAAGLTASRETVLSDPGPVFEQWLGIELWKHAQYLGGTELCHQRSKDGSEVDFIVIQQQRLIPFEAKWTEHPTLRDARHLLTFINENPRRATKGYVICRVPRPLRLHEKIVALPWSYL